MTQAASLAIQIERDASRRRRPLTLSEYDSRHAFVGVMVMLFIASTAVTVLCCNSMAAMGSMPMAGGWTMSMVWMRMPGQTWAGVTSSFLGMWIVMMGAMMLPSLAPALERYRRSLARFSELRRALLTTLVGSGYFFAWAIFGLCIFPAGAALAAIEMERPAIARVVPVAVGLVVLLAGALQFTRGKAHHLACCREALSQCSYDIAGSAWRLGLRFGLHCGISCANLTAVLLVVGVMDLRAMTLVTAAVTAERLAPSGERVARVTGSVAVMAGFMMVVRAISLA